MGLNGNENSVVIIVLPSTIYYSPFTIPQFVSAPLPLRSPAPRQRAISVIYRPETERVSHYFYARLADQFDAVLHLDQTRAVEPLERTAPWISGEAAETFPSGM